MGNGHGGRMVGVSFFCENQGGSVVHGGHNKSA